MAYNGAGAGVVDAVLFKDLLKECTAERIGSSST